ncbi:hypothetical protein GCM10020358_44190 [Amorphoplanes nipponensis]|uniref:Uncharacterized protein n=1 Tax=Actinoplanes nipponensis TaxID=135950 RepID=A0A919JDQ7_9ACTN|nr:hypothetical protein Ani05nite_23720 [Actinoplanes nipponensis]
MGREIQVVGERQLGGRHSVVSFPSYADTAERPRATMTGGEGLLTEAGGGATTGYGQRRPGNTA